MLKSSNRIRKFVDLFGVEPPMLQPQYPVLLQAQAVLQFPRKTTPQPGA